MISYLQGNILNTPAITIVNTVNTVGVMGKGIALALKNRYSDMFDQYQEACKAKELKVGKLMYYQSIDHDILLFPTKAHWRYPSRMKWIEDGLTAFCKEYESYGVSSIAFPMLGCGNGGLKWEEVKPLMEKYLSELPLQILIYTGTGPLLAGTDKPIKNYQEWLQSVALSFEIEDVLQRFSDYFMMPYEFHYQNELYQMFYLPGEIRLSSSVHNLSLNVPEDKFSELWASWKQTGLITKVNSEYKPFLHMLKTMGYLEPIHIESESGLIEGYQMLLMYDRAAKRQKGIK